MNEPSQPLPGQLDLTELVDDEHICGSMPAGAEEVALARAAFYAQLRARAGPRRPHRTTTTVQDQIDTGDSDVGGWQ